jgi:small subunit ribosomal protein S20
MANHKSALKRIRRNEAVRLRNKYQHKTMRNAFEKIAFRGRQASSFRQLPTVISMIDRLAKRNIIHN